MLVVRKKIFFTSQAHTKHTYPYGQRNLVHPRPFCPHCQPAIPRPLSTVIAVASVTLHPIRLFLAVCPPLKLSRAREAKCCSLCLGWLIGIMWTDTRVHTYTTTQRLDEECGAAVGGREPLWDCHICFCLTICEIIFCFLFFFVLSIFPACPTLESVIIKKRIVSSDGGIIHFHSLYLREHHWVEIGYSISFYNSSFKLC